MTVQFFGAILTAVGVTGMLAVAAAAIAPTSYPPELREIFVRMFLTFLVPITLTVLGIWMML
jgi:hypothetical protein